MSQVPTLERLAAALGVPLNGQALERFARYRDLLLDWNQRINLTSVEDPVEVEIKLFADALALLPYIRRYQERHPEPRPTRLVDVGTGAGVPGLALKIAAPDLDVLLIEATGKKVTFLQAAIGELGLDGVAARHGRAEELARDPNLRARFHIVTARAVARLPALLELCMPFCHPGGQGLFPKGRDAQEEVAEAKRALHILHARLVSLDPAPLPELAGTSVVVVEQSGQTPRQYPRRPGMPTKHPL